IHGHPSNRLASATPLEVTSSATIAVVNSRLMTNGVTCRDLRRVWPDNITSASTRWGAIELPHLHGEPIDKYAALKTGRGFLRRSLQEYHSRSFSAACQRACVALSSRLLIPFLTMWQRPWQEPLRRPRGPRGRCGQLLRGPFYGNAFLAAFV